ncbi:hypothetical protein Mapa_006565 [Marchantia paleacea]|nr:hypothetical protein Mapa_006565 [Marchantia paleacea]
MESPDRKDNIPAPVDQGSPFFKYLCNLSPIKSTRPRHVVQTYAELSMPPPPAVFTSPPNPNKCGGRVRRGLGVSSFVSHSSWSVDKENLPNHSYVSRSFTAVQSDSGHPSSHDALAYVSHQSTGIKQEAGDKHEDAPSKYEYSDVSDYLTEPVESGLYNNSKAYFMVKTSTVCEEFEFPGEDHIHVASQDEPSSSRLTNLPSTNEENSHDGSGNTVLAQAGSDNSLFQSGDVCSKETEGVIGSRASCESNDERNGDGNETRSSDDSLQLDQETAAMAFLLVGDVDGDGGSGSDWSAAHQAALPEFSQQQSPDFSAVERLSDGVHPRNRDDFDVAASNSLVDNRLAVADSRGTSNDDNRNELVAGPFGQRGVRRRCLDFENARRKSMGGGVSRKSLGLRPKSVVGPSELTTSRNVPPSVLCERAAATSDATNSCPSVGSTEEPQSNTPGQPRPIISGTNVKSPGLLRLTSFQRDLSSSDKLVVETTRTVIESSANRTAPSGIGLHLNSLTGNTGLHLNSLTGSISFSPNNRDVSQSLGLGSASKGAVASLLGISGISGISGNPNELRCEGFTTSVAGIGPGTKCFAMNSSTSLYSSGVQVPFLERNRLPSRDTTPIMDIAREIAKSNDIHPSTGGGRQSLDESRSLGLDVIDKKVCSIGKKRLLHHDALQQSNLDYAEEYDSPRSPKKKRKSPTSTGEKSGEGCKRCNCKKSKCLKLYCECFAAGTYCVGSCTCHDCFNKPEHEDTVLATRQQIESRNPLAFAPKIIHAADSSPKRGEEVIDTPASARHKRGCNCKKSLCLKKYCECYQAGVGCSEGCRCEGCKNMYGRKEANEEADEKEILLEALEKESQEDLDELSKPDQGGALILEQQRHMGKDLSPITPSVQYTGQGRAIGRTRSIGKKRSSSPLSQPCGGLLQRSPTDSSQSPLNLCGDANFSAHQNPEFQLSKTERSPNSTPKFTRISQLSPRWERLGDICTLTPLPQAPLRPTPASISTLERTGASPCFNRQSMEAVSSYQSDLADFTSLGKPSSFQLPPDDSPPSPSNRRISQSTSRQTPCTPSLSSPAFTGKEEMTFGDSRSGQFACYSQDDDDTPDFLRYSEDAHSPLISKTSSPKQKRVSPPHFEGLREKCRGDNRNIFDSPARSSPGLRSSRKFILTAISGLPSPHSSMGPTLQGHIGNSQKKG